MSAEVSAKMKLFLELARVLRQGRDKTFTAPTKAVALEEVADYATMLDANFQDGDSALAKLENTAGLLHSALALADLILDGLDEAEIRMLIAETGS
ncbi:hypothetical protein CfE428DRAFT_5832 [Chthoniobacter flavus Ellin428]|uniref:Uncharacterized protein n=1 Tax=Chthoniobacter flavus Ellin428 TaxID=497964 RepID=B4DA92_9BACT|nr:hypothetical protein [Chthoniobacter flavus]EDY16719.1 hypothetical protein CfE428DRAFT_5832 [Chthoniobacter flavus Ellin428]